MIECPCRTVQKKGQVIMDRKAVFFDIDGTLWDEKGWIPGSTREAIRLLREQGHYAFICSGRASSFIRDEGLLSLGFDGIVAGCGTYAEYHGQTLFYKTLEQELIGRTLHILREHGIPTIYEGRYHLYMDVEEFAQDPYALHVKELLGDEAYPVTGHETDMEISKFSCSTRGVAYQDVLPLLETDFTVMVHQENCFECVPKGYSKATGMEEVCRRLGVAHEETYAFGDSVNDVEMLRFAAHGIAMGNGGPEAKAAADYVTLPLAEDGIYHGLRHYGLI